MYVLMRAVHATSSTQEELQAEFANEIDFCMLAR